uniref:NADH dehydrogenase subunit 2 n=1 Tax=Cryptocotyle lingua TaxID=66766 RepID=UPI0020280B6D|nr:NADH dehydrogenase subunit 2 [Cryptocotyle lingua]UQU69048.1 NADH dehydrogenase subunit 2 [Cryptocotyle lingua]
MRGVVLSTFSVFWVLFFSVVLFFSDNLLMFWLFLELATLGLIPSFFLYLDSGVLGSLFSYIIISGVSSSLIISGLLFDSFFFFAVLGLFIKFGLFPFLGWVYIVVINSNWLVVWGLSTVLKSSFLFFSFFLSNGWESSLVELCCIFTFFFVGVLFWVYTNDWTYYWCHVMISSSAALVVMAIEISVDVLVWLFMVYLAWSTLVIYLLSYFDSMEVKTSAFFFFCVFLLVSFPGSLAIFYKLIIGISIYSCGLLVFLSWVFYNISEQFFLVKYLISIGIPRSEWNGVSLV